MVIVPLLPLDGTKGSVDLGVVATVSGIDVSAPVVVDVGDIVVVVLVVVAVVVVCIVVVVVVVVVLVVVGTVVVVGCKVL